MTFSPLAKDTILSSAFDCRTWLWRNFHEDQRADAFKYRRVFARKSSKLQHPIIPEPEPRRNAGASETINILIVPTTEKQNSWSDMVEEEIESGTLEPFEPLERCPSRLSHVSFATSAEEPEVSKIASDASSSVPEEECAEDKEYFREDDERMKQLTVPMSRADLPYRLDNTAFPNFANVWLQSLIHDVHVKGWTVLEIAQGLENDGYDAKIVYPGREEYTMTRCIVEVIGMWDPSWGRFEEISRRGVSLPVPESRQVQQLASAKFNDWVQQQANTKVREIDDDSDSDSDEDEDDSAFSGIGRDGYNKFNVLPQSSQYVLRDSEGKDDGISPTAKEYDFSDEEYDSWEEDVNDGGISEDEETLMDQF